MPEYNSGSGTYFTEKYRVIVISFVRVTWVVYGDSSSRICGGAVRWCYRKWRDRKWRQSHALSGNMFCACVTGNSIISFLVGPFSPEVTKSRDRKRPLEIWPERRRLRHHQSPSTDNSHQEVLEKRKTSLSLMEVFNIALKCRVFRF